jgi:hypothetical protein
VKAAFPRARDQSLAPEPGLFESRDDAAAVLAIKATLTSTFRRRFVVTVDGLVWPDLPSSSEEAGVPTWRLVDAELGVDADCMVTRVAVDLENELTRMEMIG